ncbi:MAG: histidinol-phosphatase [Cellulomonadaceae bacterium]|nr:histidinol-phosphatase [Cellulomonadaceae bacterium]
MTAAASTFDDDLRLAHLIADQVDAITMARFRAADLRVDTKADLSPVTDADTAAEEYIRSQLRRSRGRDSVLGEEFGSSAGGARRWIVDPIDGTKNYVRGVPVWATLIGLAMEDQVVMGVVSAPALGRRWWAAAGSGAWTGRALGSATQLRVSSVGRLEEASFSYSSLGGWETQGRLPGFLQLTRRCDRTRAYGDFWSYMMVAEGAVDIAAEPELEVYDMAALVPIVTEAGGTFTSIEGEPGPWGGNAVATNGLLHSEALVYFG